MRFSTRHSFRSFPQGAWACAGGGRTDRASSPFSLSAEVPLRQLLLPVSPSVPSSRDTRAHAPGPCHRAMPSPSKNEVTHTTATKVGRTKACKAPASLSLSPLTPIPPPSSKQASKQATPSAYPWPPVPEKRAAEYRTDMSGLVTRATSRPALFPIVSLQL